MIRAVLRLAGWPWFTPSTADLLRLREARAKARNKALEARRHHERSRDADKLFIDATAAVLAAEIGRKG